MKDFIINFFKAVKAFDIFPADWFNSNLLKNLCFISNDICKQIVKVAADSDPDINDVTATKVFFGHFPSGSSLKCAEHFTQLALAQNFQRFDYGPKENMKRYNQI